MDFKESTLYTEEKRQEKLRNRSKLRKMTESLKWEELDSVTSDEDKLRQETLPSGCKELYERCQQTFINHGYYCDEEEAAAIGELLKRIWDANEQLERECVEWRRQEEKIERNKEAIHKDINERRDEMVRIVEEYAQSLHQRADALLNAKLEKAQDQLSNMKLVLREYDRLFAESWASEEGSQSKVKGYLEELNQKAGEVMATSAREWPTLVLSKTNPVKPLLTSLFGCLEGGATGSGWLSGLPGSSAKGSEFVEILSGHDAKLNDEELEKSGSADELEKDDNRQIGDTVLLRKPTILKQFLAKTKKERRDIGITDAAVTSVGDVIVIDKHNKLVKMFDAEARFLRFVGRKLVKAPSRVTILSDSGEILITDKSSQSVKVFDPEGVTYRGLFADDLQQPISHCQTADGQVAVVDFSTRNVVIYERSGKALHHFDTGLRCPTYVAGTRNGNIAVSDWRHSIVRIYDPVGNLVTEMHRSSGHGIHTPYGVFGDAHGYLIVSDSGDNGIRIFTEDGVPLTNLSLKDYGLKLPMAVCQHHIESLVSVDYQGTVKVIKYADVGRQVVDLSAES